MALTPCVAMTAALAGALACAIAHAQAPEDLELVLAVGEQRVISSESVASYSEGVPGVVDVRLTRDGQRFVIVARRAGTTSLLLIRRDGSELRYRIRVADAPGAGPATDDDPTGRVDARDNIRLDFYFVQLSDDYRHQLGIAWPSSIGGASLSAGVDLTSGTLTDATAVISDQALPRLDIAQATGFAKLLREAAVIAQNGSEASFSGGGEVNIPVESAFGVGVRQIVFGSTIRVRPRYDRDSARIELAIHADVSDLAGDGGSGIPGRTTATLDSVVNLELGQSLVLAGLTASSEARASAGLPWLSQLPILGALFGSHQRRSQRLQNVVFIVPSVVDAVSLEARERVREAWRAFRDYDGDSDEIALRERVGGEPRRGGQR